MMPTLWSSQLVLAMLLNGVVQCIQIGAYAARLAGVKSGRVATSISLFNLFVTASRLANLFYAPMLGTISDRAAHAMRFSGASSTIVHQFEEQLRLIVVAGTIGTALGALLMPVFLYLFLRGIASFERLGSVPRAMLRLGDPRVVTAVARSLRLPSPQMLARFSAAHVPMKLLVGNTIVVGIYAVGVQAATYASVLNPAESRTAVLLSGIINGIATIAFTLVVDPTSAYITDQAVRGERSIAEVKSMIFYLALTAIIGTLLSQLILYPSAVVIGYAAHLVNALQ
jgi:Alternate to MurJ